MAVKKDFDFSTIQSISVKEIKDIPGYSGTGAAIKRVIFHQLLKDDINVTDMPQASLSDSSNVRGSDATLICTVTEFKDSRSVLVPVEILNKGHSVQTVERKVISEKEVTTTTPTHRHRHKHPAKVEQEHFHIHSHKNGETHSHLHKHPKDKDIQVKTVTKEELIKDNTVHYKGGVTKTRQFRHVDAVISLNFQLVDNKTSSVIWSSNYSYNSLDRFTAINNCVKGALWTLKSFVKK